MVQAVDHLRVEPADSAAAAADTIPVLVTAAAAAAAILEVALAMREAAKQPQQVEAAVLL